jgi:hypothetical protein
MSQVSAVSYPSDVPFFIIQETECCISYIVKFCMLLFQWLREQSTINEHFSQLSKDNIRWLTKHQIEGVNPEKIQLLTQEQLEAFTPEVVFNFFSVEQAKAYSRAFRNATKLWWHVEHRTNSLDVFHCIDKLDLVAVRSRLSNKDMFAFFNEELMREFTLEQIQQIQPYIGGSAFSKLSTAQRQSLLTTEMSKGQVANIFRFANQRYIHEFTPEQINGLQTHLKFDNFTELSRTQLQAIQMEDLSDSQIFSLISFMSNLNDLTSEQLRKIKIEVIATPELLQKLLPRISELSFSQLQVLRRSYNVSISEEENTAERKRR